MEAILNQEIRIDRTLLRVLSVAVFVALIALGAYIRIPLPFTPVPLTLQTFFVLLSASVLGARLGGLTQIIYISLGAAGLSIFTGAGGGLLYLCGPSAGYLFGFIVAGIVAGRFVRYGRDNLAAIFLILVFADLLILCCGAVWLKFIFGFSLAKSLSVGLLPFLPGDLVKALAASIVYLRLKKI